MDEQLFITSINYRKIFMELSLKEKFRNLSDEEKSLYITAHNSIGPEGRMIIRMNLFLKEEMENLSFESWMEHGPKTQFKVMCHYKTQF